MLPTVFATLHQVPKGCLQEMNGLSQRAQRANEPPISDLMHRALSRPELISLAAGFVDQLSLPVDHVREAVDALLADPVRSRKALQYGTTTGDPELRDMLRVRFLAADRLAASALAADQLVITAGSNQLLHHVADTLLDPGDLVICANTYFVFWASWRIWEPVPLVSKSMPKGSFRQRSRPRSKSFASKDDSPRSKPSM